MNEDSIKATPQSPVMGLFANGLSRIDGALDGAGLGLLSRGFGIPSAAAVASDMSYGSPPYRGAGMATRLSPDLVSALGGITSLGAYGPISNAAKVGAVGLGAGMMENKSMDSLIQDLLNALGRQNQGK